MLVTALGSIRVASSILRVEAEGEDVSFAAMAQDSDRVLGARPSALSEVNMEPYALLVGESQMEYSGRQTDLVIDLDDAQVRKPSTATRTTTAVSPPHANGPIGGFESSDAICLLHGNAAARSSGTFLTWLCVHV